ncbi:NAD-binding protein, partial [Anaerosporobacter sp.]
MANKEFVVFGLGRFGKSVATTLADSGCEVLVVDDNEDKIQEMADIVTYAV